MRRPSLLAALLLMSFAIAPLVIASGLQPSATALSLSPDRTARDGDEVTLIATVAPVLADDGAPGGSVEFFDGMTSLGSARLTADQGRQVARLTWRAAAGSHSLSARYSGDAAFASSASLPIVCPVTSREGEAR